MYSAASPHFLVDVSCGVWSCAQSCPTLRPPWTVARQAPLFNTLFFTVWNSIRFLGEKRILIMHIVVSWIPICEALSYEEKYILK